MKTPPDRTCPAKRACRDVVFILHGPIFIEMNAVEWYLPGMSFINQDIHALECELLNGLALDERLISMTETNRRMRNLQTERQQDHRGIIESGNNPERGPKVLFFSGGTALRELSRTLIRDTHNSVHIVTPFDSGGSSAELRRAFHMPAVGDIRNRLMALCDLRQPGNPEVFQLFSHRLSKEGDHRELHNELARMARGQHPLVDRILDPMRRIVCHHLDSFLDFMPETFDLQGASIGNIMLTAGYLTNDREFEPVIALFSKLLHVCGQVRPVVNAHLHLAAILDDGTFLFGQHRITGKQCAPIENRIKRLFLTQKADAPPEPVRLFIEPEIRRFIGQADLICYPMGSFYSSLITNLLPGGVGRAISEAGCPKIYIPSTGNDPEAKGLGPADQVEILLDYLKADAPDRIRTEQVLHAVVLDCGIDLSKEEEERICATGVQLIRQPLVTRDSAPYIDRTALAQLLISWTGG